MMKKMFVFFVAFLFVTSCTGSKNKSGNKQEENPGSTPEVEFPKFSFCPNQFAGSPWHIENGHLDESFGVAEHWPVLLQNLKKSGGAFSIYACEIGYLKTTSGLLPLLKQHDIPLSVEIPGMTQAILGGPLAEAEFNGRLVNGKNIFNQIFMINKLDDRPSPDNHGWFYTHDRKDMIPDEILLDERQPNLCPYIDYNILVDRTLGDFQTRLNAAKRPNGHPSCMLPMDQLLKALRTDYVDYLNVVKVKWGDQMPKIGLHWNVNVWWEIWDQTSILAVNAKNPDYYSNPDNMWYAYRHYPELHYRSVEYLRQMVNQLTEAGLKPTRVLMDVDWTYDMDYVKNLLLAHREALAELGVQMGINVIGSISKNPDGSPQNIGWVYRNNTLEKTEVSGKSYNEIFEASTLAIIHYLKGEGIADDKMQLRVCSWESLPEEQGSQVDEKISGSMAHLGNAAYALIE